MTDKPYCRPLMPEDDMPLDGELEQWEIDAGVILSTNG
jgi:hypothetical protein